MSNYALIDISSGIVVNSIVLNDPADWTSPTGFIVVQTGVGGIGWCYEDGIFSPPPIPPLTQEEIIYRNTNDQADRLNQASKVMTPILVSLQLGDATDDETVGARKWQAYYRALKVVDLSVPSPVWPDVPEIPV
ncbi:tail fiber assembly protein [Pseudomonas mohnii]